MVENLAWGSTVVIGYKPGWLPTRASSVVYFIHIGAEYTENYSKFGEKLMNFSVCGWGKLFFRQSIISFTTGLASIWSYWSFQVSCQCSIGKRKWTKIILLIKPRRWTISVTPAVNNQWTGLVGTITKNFSPCPCAYR